MSLEDKAKAVAKNIEGKAQEVLGKVTGNQADEIAGKAKQAEAATRNAIEDAKDSVKDALK
ncbi:MAG: hypothetical protein RLZZ511_2802 [Cyanobacteriota bacterium]|jgi:uncharacterized protein YjbJ (UPF0337 family)